MCGSTPDNPGTSKKPQEVWVVQYSAPCDGGCSLLMDSVVRVASSPPTHPAPLLSTSCTPLVVPGHLQEVTTPLGQLSYATPALLEAKGVPEERRRPEALLAAPPKDLLTHVEEVAGGWVAHAMLAALARLAGWLAA